MPRVIITSPTTVQPNPIPLRRDDQTIMWELAPGLEWAHNPPIVMLAGGGTAPNGQPFSDWPSSGTLPSPILNGNPPVTVPFWASANQPMPNNETQWYHYAMDVVTIAEDGTRQVHRVQVQHADGEWHDPDVENQPKP